MLTSRLCCGWRQLPELVGGPGRRRALHDVKVEHLAALVGQDKEDIEEAKVDGGDGEEIHGRHLSQVVAQKRGPGLRRRTTGARDHVLGDGALREGEAQRGQLAVDPQGVPEWVGAVHLPDQADHLAVDGPPAAATRTTLPFPELAKAGAMPADDRVRSNDPQAGFPGPPPSREPDPKGTIWTRQARWSGGEVEHQELATEGQVLEDQVATTPHRRRGQTKEQHEPGNHAVEDARRPARIPLLSGVPRTFPLPASPQFPLPPVNQGLPFAVGDARTEPGSPEFITRSLLHRPRAGLTGTQACSIIG